MTLDEALTRSGMTAYQLSKKSGVSQGKISQIRDGKISIENISLKTAVALADALGIEAKELLKNRRRNNHEKEIL